MTTNRLIAWLTGILTLSLAVFSFILSFNALTDLAAQHKVSIPYLFPFLVEFAVVIFSLNALYRSLNGESATWQWTLIIGSSLLAGTFNVVHAEANLVSQTMAAMPSLFLLLSFETFLGQLKHSVKRTNVIKSIEQLKTELEQLSGNLQTLQRQKATIAQQLTDLEKQKKTVQHTALNAHNAKTVQDKQQALNALLNFYRSNPNATLAEAGAAIYRAKSTVSNYLDELEQNGLLHRNGQGVEVVEQ